MLPNVGPMELIIILAIALLIVGPKRLPEMGTAMGRTIREFRKATSDITDGAKTEATAAKPGASPAAAASDLAATSETGTATEATDEGSGTLQERP
jgi:sec-independent protein translocase protein TatA